MDKIIMIRDMHTEDDVLKLQKHLEELDFKCTVKLPTRVVVVHGDNDNLYAAKQAIARAGYTIL